MEEFGIDVLLFMLSFFYINISIFLEFLCHLQEIIHFEREREPQDVTWLCLITLHSFLPTESTLPSLLSFKALGGNGVSFKAFDTVKFSSILDILLWKIKLKVNLTEGSARCQSRVTPIHGTDIPYKQEACVVAAPLLVQLPV